MWGEGLQYSKVQSRVVTLEEDKRVSSTHTCWGEIVFRQKEVQMLRGENRIQISGKLDGKWLTQRGASERLVQGIGSGESEDFEPCIFFKLNLNKNPLKVGVET